MFTWNGRLFGNQTTYYLGYKALSQDYEDGGFEWDVVAHGPGLGFEIRF